MYCSLEEAWGSDFKKEKKDKKKKKREYDVPQRGSEDRRFKPVMNHLEIDENVLIEPPRTWKSSNALEKEVPLIQPFDYYSSNEKQLEYQPYSTEVRQTGTQYRKPIERTASVPQMAQKDGYVQVPLTEYQKLVEEKEQQIQRNLSHGQRVIEGFTTNDDEFNQLLLYIFTGIFLLISHDLMFQLGRRSY